MPVHLLLARQLYQISGRLGIKMKSGTEKAFAQGHGLGKATAVDVKSQRNVLVVTINIPIRGGVAQRAQRAMLRHADRLKSSVESLVDGVMASPRPAASVKKLAESLQPPAKPLDVRAARTKQARETIGVVSAVHLKQVLSDEAEERDVPFAEVAREMFELGLDRLEARLWTEPSGDVLAEFKQSYEHFDAEETKQWSLRIPRRAFLRAALIAQEHGLSHSQLACRCIAVGLELEVA